MRFKGLILSLNKKNKLGEKDSGIKDYQPKRCARIGQMDGGEQGDGIEEGIECQAAPAQLESHPFGEDIVGV